ncbi:hypothetical protein EGI15_18190 [Chryseobacterium cucumeris]|uniref:YD repeat-containing protein n=2 Tax=Chryseobacterium cucumeris TaxID=1813611 RepID=A0ABX9X453_9FLAO|nr:hypothetical protein [Chryseobacterium cucumeris]ROH90589.1 hypothetical protein EGI15_18190 [Chryseobacterium cucumeris]
MKKFLFLGLMSSVVFFNSCSSNDDNEGNNTSAKVLLSKVTIIYYDNPSQPQTSIQTLEYNNQGELIKTTSALGTSKFEYSNGKPTKTTYYKPDGT